MIANPAFRTKNVMLPELCFGEGIKENSGFLLVEQKGCGDMFL